MALNRFYWPVKYNTRYDFLKQGVKCVFLSHQKKDGEDAKKIADYLINAGIDVYFDEYDKDLKIHHQANNAKAVTSSIKNGINNSSHMIVLVSPNTLYSTWVPFEIGYGYDRTELFTLCLKGISKGGLPEYLKSSTIIRDIYDFNVFCENITGIKKEKLILETKLSDFNSIYNPLSNVMDTLIQDNY